MKTPTGSQPTVSGGRLPSVPAGMCDKHYPAVVRDCKECRAWIDKQAKGSMNRQAKDYRVKG